MSDTLAIITDTHVGCRSSSSIFREYFRWWYSTQFFPELDKRGVTEILHLGDFFDNRNSISLQDIDFVVNYFANELKERDIQFTITLGNHDVAYKNTNKIHSLSMLKSAAPDHVTVIEEAQEMTIAGHDFVLVPWINASNYDETFEIVNGTKDKKNKIIAGHFEIQGAKHYKNSPPAEHGLDGKLFSEFKELWSGHFHHKSKVGNIRYMGSAFHMNWQDHNDERGYHFYDGDLEYVENEYSLFTEVAFDQEIFAEMTPEEYVDAFGSKFVRVYVVGEYSKVALMDTVSKINKTKPHDLQVITEATTGESTVTPEDVEDRTSKSIPEYIDLFVEELKLDSQVKVILDDLYKKAQDKMAVGE